MREIRRKDRILEEEVACQLLQAGEYGFLAMVNKDGGGYGIPISYVYDGNGHIYFHGATEGHKIENLAADNKVSFTVVGKTEVIPQQFSTLYESVMVFGTTHMDLDDEERTKALWLIVEKYSPEFKEVAEKYIKGSFGRTLMIRLDIEAITAKSKR